MVTTTDRRFVAAVLVALGALFVLPGLFMGVGMMGFAPMTGGMWGGGMWGGPWGHGTAAGWMAIVGAVVSLAFLVLVVVAGYAAYRLLTDGSESDRAFDELRQAYARGDLSDEEYERRRDVLERDE